MAIADRHGLPLSVAIFAGQRHEVGLVHATLNARFVTQAPRRLVGDKAYDSANLQASLASQRIDLIAPTRARSRARKQDGRKLRRYRRRWKVERLFAWLLRYRRITTRYEYKPANFLAFIQLACILLLTRHL